ncbi:MAG: D-tyrosyl-tRNA(Tyr) deacylase [Algoriphagus sp.]|jgi:D-tyrosyl-tRNA(Tyr) deacylase
MIVVIQRVAEASVKIDGKVKCEIGVGLLILVGIEEADAEEDISWLSKKIANLRMYPDDNQVMNKSIMDVAGEVLLISQFTLLASTKKGNRPSYIKAARPEVAIPLYENFIQTLESELGKPIRTGEFGADMKVALINDGPVTILIDSKDRK